MFRTTAGTQNRLRHLIQFPDDHELLQSDMQTQLWYQKFPWTGQASTLATPSEPCVIRTVKERSGEFYESYTDDGGIPRPR